MLKPKQFDRLASAQNSPKSPSSNHSKTDIESLVKQIEQERSQRRQAMMTDLFQQLLQDASQITIKQSPPHQHQPQHEPSSSQSLAPHPPRLQGCKCSKISCLKLYCECFNRGEICGSTCSCLNCHNKPGFEHQIHSAKMMTNYRHPNYFTGVQAFVPAKKCTCKKSHCVKKYCECYNSGERCSADCECSDCHNRDIEDQNGSISYMEIQVKG